MNYKPELPHAGLYKSARLSHLWNAIMSIAGYWDYCESTSEFHWVTYAYTLDAPEACIKFGNRMWDILKEWVGESDPHHQDAHISVAHITTVTRRHELWDR